MYPPLANLPLPASVQLETPAILRQAIQAHRWLGELKAASKDIPNPGILIDTLGLQEARDSSAIENIITTQDGANLVRPVGGADNLGRISGVIESEFIEEGSWYLVPSKGTTEVPTLLRVKLAGYTSPEVYVSNFNGAPIAGGASSNPFQAFSFDNDSVDLKHRQFVNAALFSEDALVWSDGSGA